MMEKKRFLQCGVLGAEFALCPSERDRQPPIHPISHSCGALLSRSNVHDCNKVNSSPVYACSTVTMYLSSLPLSLILVGTGLCVTSPSSGTQTCTGCQVAGFTDASNPNALDPNATEVSFIGYAVTQTFEPSSGAIGGACSTTTEGLITLPTPFLVTIPSTVDIQRYQPTAESIFFRHLGSAAGLSNCINAHTTSPTSSVGLSTSPTLATSSASSQTQSPSLTSTSESSKPNTSDSGFARSDSIALEVVVPLCVVLLLLAAFIFWRTRQQRRRFHLDKSEVAETKAGAVSIGSEPYLQPKAELDDIGNRRHELAANEPRKHELHQDSMHEMAGNKETQELGVGYPSGELQAAPH